jgi:hypothetical protein
MRIRSTERIRLCSALDTLFLDWFYRLHVIEQQSFLVRNIETMLLQLFSGRGPEKDSALPIVAGQTDRNKDKNIF